MSIVDGNPWSLAHRFATALDHRRMLADRLTRCQADDSNLFLTVDRLIGKGAGMDVQGLLRAAMKNDARTQRELAEASGIHFVNLSRFAAGKKSLTIESAEALAKALGLEIDVRKVARKRAASSKRS